MCCPEDWEPRHPADFYRGRNDSHKLPWTRPDDGADPTKVWAAQSILLLSYSVNSKEQATNPAGVYFLDTLKLKTVGSVQLALFMDAATGKLPVLFPLSTTTSAGGTLVLPTTPTTSGSIVVRTTYKLLGTVAVTAGSANVTMPSWTSQPGNVLINFTYGT